MSIGKTDLRLQAYARRSCLTPAQRTASAAALVDALRPWVTGRVAAYASTGDEPGTRRLLAALDDVLLPVLLADGDLDWALHEGELVDGRRGTRQPPGPRLGRDAVADCDLVVVPALAVGCTMVLKPSEIAPLSGTLFAQVMHDAGVPPGVFNLVNGAGPEVGARMSTHPEVDMVSFTGSTRAGTQIAAVAAATAKRVAQEMGGKSPNIILPGANIAEAVAAGVTAVMSNTGQSCDAPTRMLVHRSQQAEALQAAKEAAEAIRIGDPRDEETVMGPLVSKMQFDKVQKLIQAGIDEGATLVTGGVGRPVGVNRGWFVRPTVFGDVVNAMTISKEEIFGPVLAIQPYDSIEDAIAQANDTIYGLAAYIAGPIEDAIPVARKLRAGTVNLNYPDWDTSAPFGGYKQSGNGREYADWGIHDFCEVKGIVGYGA